MEPPGNNNNDEDEANRGLISDSDQPTHYNYSQQFPPPDQQQQALMYASAMQVSAMVCAQAAQMAADYAAGHGPPPWQLYPMPPPAFGQPPSYYQQPYRRPRAPPSEVVHVKSRRRMRSSDGDTSSGASSNSYRQHFKKKPRSDESLLGKAAVAALYEFCGKRHLVPNFNVVQKQLFHVSVTINQEEKATGEASTKASAKAIGARRALEAMLPGILFDDETNIVVALPSSDETISAEDLAPNLAKRLAIGHSDEKKAKRRSFDVYPGTSTSDDEGSTHVSASVFSSLLHAMQQIDPKLPEAPQFEYEIIDAITAKSPTSAGSVVRVHRGSYTCIATMKRIPEETPDEAEILTATGAGSTKRDARHNACSKLLSLLFPQCESLMEVKAAAEAAREAYASSRSQSRNLDSKPAAKRKSRDLLFERDLGGDDGNTVNLTDEVKQIYSKILETKGSKNPSPPIKRSKREESRQIQLNQILSKALEAVNDPDGKTRSEDNEDDVGKTILREAETDDWPAMKKLLGVSYDHLNQMTNGSIVLLLCRAIAAFEDPPLGCAVLSPSFSMDHGKVLYISQIATESHLPSERFIECLEAFAAQMKCSLQRKSRGVVYSRDQLSRFVRKHVEVPNAEASLPRRQVRAARLSSVQEESEAESSHGDEASKKTPKPTKRSRVK